MEHRYTPTNTLAMLTSSGVGDDPAFLEAASATADRRKRTPWSRELLSLPELGKGRARASIISWTVCGKENT